MKRKDNSGYTSIYRIDAFSNAPESDNRFERKKEKRKQKQTWNHEPYIARKALGSALKSAAANQALFKTFQDKTLARLESNFSSNKKP